MKLNKNHINPIIYSLLYLSLIIGFILNEDFVDLVDLRDLFD